MDCTYIWNNEKYTEQQLIDAVGTTGFENLKRQGLAVEQIYGEMLSTHNYVGIGDDNNMVSTNTNTATDTDILKADGYNLLFADGLVDTQRLINPVKSVFKNPNSDGNGILSCPISLLPSVLLTCCWLQYLLSPMLYHQR